MINGDLNEFVELAKLGREEWFKFNDNKYLLEGWFDEKQSSDKRGYISISIVKNGSLELIKEWYAPTNIDAANKFFNEQLFDGKTFFEIQKDCEWYDEDKF